MENTQEMNESETTNPDDISPGSPSIWWTCGNQIRNHPKQHWKHCLSKWLEHTVPSGELTFCHGKSPFLMGKSTISMAMFHSYVSLPEGNPNRTPV